MTTRAFLSRATLQDYNEVSVLLQGSFEMSRLMKRIVGLRFTKMVAKLLKNTRRSSGHISRLFYEEGNERQVITDLCLIILDDMLWKEGVFTSAHSGWKLENWWGFRQLSIISLCFWSRSRNTIRESLSIPFTLKHTDDYTVYNFNVIFLHFSTWTSYIKTGLEWDGRLDKKFYFKKRQQILCFNPCS